MAQEVIPAAHNYEAVYTEPSFDSDGFTTYTCACGDTYTETDTGTMKIAAASIGGVKYETLSEAFAEAKAGDTIVMLKSYTIAGGTAETWDLTGKTLEISSTGVGISVEGNLRILGGTFNSGILVRKNGKVTIEAGTFHISGSIWIEYGSVTINGGTFYVTGEGRFVTKACGIGSNEFTRFTINDGTFYFRDNGKFFDYGDSTINGGTFYLENQKKASILAGWSDYRDPLTIKGGTFYVGGPVGIEVDVGGAQFYIHGGSFITTVEGANILKDGGGAIGIYGGTFSQDMTPYLSESYCCTKVDDYYVVGQHHYNVKKVADAYLKTPASCTNAAEYYLSCACGKKGTDTFQDGDALQHSFTNYVSNGDATCTENGTETAVCDYGCGATDTRELPNSAKGHTYQKGICTVCGYVNKCGDNLTWSLDEEGALTISGTGAMYDFTLSNPAPWYDCRKEIKELIIENGVTTIGSYAFYGCTGLTSVAIPESVISIGAYAFGECGSLKNIEVPESVERIDGSAWSGSGIGSVVIGGGDPLEEDDFKGYEGLSEIWFRSDFPGIGENVFRNVTATAYYPADNQTWTEDKLQNYGGIITWKPYCLGEHTVVIDEAVAPTCKSVGLTEGRHCSACGEILLAQEEIPATGIHNYVDTVCTYCGAIGGIYDDNISWTLVDGTLTISGSGEMPWLDINGTADVPWRDYEDQVTAVVIERILDMRCSAGWKI